MRTGWELNNCTTTFIVGLPRVRGTRKCTRVAGWAGRIFLSCRTKRHCTNKTTRTRLAKCDERIARIFLKASTFLIIVIIFLHRETSGVYPCPFEGGKGQQNLNHKFPPRTLPVDRTQATLPRGQLHKHLVVSRVLQQPATRQCFPCV